MNHFRNLLLVVMMKPLVMRMMLHCFIPVPQIWQFRLH